MWRPAERSLLVARGLVPGHSEVRVFGNNPACGTTEEAIWFGSVAKTYLSVAAPLRIRVGGDAEDSAAGDGARSIRVIGLDADFEPIEEVIVTTGASQSAETTQSFMRMHKAYVEEVGLYGGTNANDILIESNGGVLMAQMPGGASETQLGWITVPAGKTAYIEKVVWFIPDAALMQVRIKTRENADDIVAPMSPFRTRWVGNMTQPGIPTNGAPVIVPEKSDIICTGEASTGTHEVSVEMTVTFVDN